ncbi:non-ribosomal peptide synthetase [Massilia aquatica]|uniref:Amino acid adenylation domain-containing protein n=1 Tax=Massilia aquatica TaxID=2609000 RepID=A0ABX0M3K3_9BURK|nr:non-ribosomal peptide synthetase [Massilia aquatica]NHZ41744.1 amino acid adenylation domain-containing protein [Massilia aquatica]
MSTHIEAVYPLSPLQQGLLFHTVSRPGEPTYFEQICCSIRGTLDRAAFEQAWNWVLARHPVLRTAFAYKQAQEPMQVVGRQVRLALDWADWRAQAAPEQAWQALLQADRDQGFDMAKAPLMRLTARQLDAAHHLFVWSHHHILLDGWSFGLVLHEVLGCYAELVRCGRPPVLPAARPFADFIDYLRRRDQQADERFWQRYLAGCSAPTRLAVDRGQGVHEGGGKAEVTLSVQLDERASELVKSSCARLGVSLSALVHGAWARLLGAYSGERQVMFGTTTAGRPPELSGVEQMVGLFINAVPLLVDIDPQARVGDWLLALQRALFEVQEHQYTGLGRIQELSPLQRGNPLFETLLSFQNYPLEEGHLQSWEGIRLTDYSWTGPTNYPLAVRAFPGERIMLVLTYYQHRLDDEVAAAMLDQLHSLVERLGSAPQRFMWEVAPVAGAHAERMLGQWNATAFPYAERQTLHGLAERQASLRPQQLALVAGDERLSYAELDTRANQLARYLQQQGVGPGDRVGLCTDKSAATVIGMLAIMKAGAAYVPLDPAYPPARIAYMAGDARLKVLLTWGSGGAATAGLELARIALDADRERYAALPGEPLALDVSPDAFAYVIYTSGSSGHPKGVMLNHRGRVNNVEDYCRMFNIGPQDRTLCVSSLSFDISVCDLFWTLQAGATLVFPSPGHEKDPAHWLALLGREGITLWHSAPALMDALLETAADAAAQDGHGHGAPGLRLALLDGDWIPLSMPDRVRAAFPQAQVVSAGGATELSIDSLTFPVGAVDPAWRSIPYGKPMGNQSAYIVDQNLEATPVGVPGELLLGGAGIAAGYFERPGLSAEKFIPHPWPGVPGERLYRTGDLARFGADGTIELIGRIDFQVKIRGIRIELGEIEATLRSHPLVAACLVSAPADAAGERRLAAYVVAAGPGADTLGATLRAWLRQRLPETLVPEAFVLLDKLPLSANGKIDRRALPPAQFAAGTSCRSAPANALEEALARHWAGVLGMDPELLDVGTSFFDLGGNSLKALRACRLPGRPIPVTALYQYRSVRALAEHLGAGQREAGVLVALTRAEAAPVAICVPYGGGHAGVYQGLAEALEGRISVHAVRLPGHEHDGSDEPLQPIESVAAAVVQAAARFCGRPLLVYGHCGGVALATEIARRLESGAHDLRALVVGASYPPRQAAELEHDPFAGQSDQDLAMGFARLGGFGELSAAEAQAIGRLLRHDGAEARRYFRARLGQAGEKVRTPLTCLIGQSDPLTSGYAGQWSAWRLCAERCELQVLPGDHYFVRHSPHLVAERLMAALANAENNNLEVSA